MPNARRNYLLHLLNGVVIAVSDALNDPTLIMTALISQLTTSNVLIGLLAPLRDTGWFLPQLFISHLVQRAPQKIVFYRASIVTRVAGSALISIALFVFDDPSTLLWTFFACTLLISISGGVGGLSYLTVTAKVIPPERRGTLFGLREFLGGGLSVLMGGVGALILSGSLLGVSFPFPRNYGVLFAVSGIFFAAGLMLFGAIREPPDEISTGRVSLRMQLARARIAFTSNAPFRRFVMARAALLFARAGTPFVTVFAKRILNISDAYLASLVSVTLIFALLAGLGWGRLNDRRGSRTVLVCSVALGMLTFVLAFVMMVVPAAVAPLLVAACVVSASIGASGLNVALLPMMIDIVPADERPLYFGLNNSTLGVILLMTSLVGLLVDVGGYVTLFAFCFACYGLALERLLRGGDQLGVPGCCPRTPFAYPRIHTIHA
jgi:MFS family permease